MIHPRFFYSLSKASLALALSFTPLVGYAQPPLDFSGALSQALVATPAPEVTALTVRGFESIPDSLLAYLCTYFSEDERCSLTRQLSKNFDKAVTDTLGWEYPLGEMTGVIPTQIRDQGTPLDVVRHAMAPLRAIELLESYLEVRKTTTGFEEKFPEKPDPKVKRTLIRKLNHLEHSLSLGSYPQQFVWMLKQWVETGLDSSRRENLCRVVAEIQQISEQSKMPLTYDLLAFCQLRGIGMEKKADLEKNSFLQSLQTLKKELKLSQKMMPLIRSLRLNDYLTLKAQLWPIVIQVKALRPKLDLPLLTNEKRDSFQILKKTNLLDAWEAFSCGCFFENQEDLVRALSFYQYSAGLGHATAQNYVGYAYKYGIGTQIGFDIALYYYQLAASQNRPAAHWNIGRLLEGLRYRGNDDLALHHFSKAAEIYQADKKQSNYLDSIVEMAYLHLWGHLTSPDRVLAIRYLIHAEEEKNTSAYMYLAYCYQSGLIFNKNLKIALSYLEKVRLEGTEEQKALAEERRKSWTKEINPE